MWREHQQRIEYKHNMKHHGPKITTTTTMIHIWWTYMGKGKKERRKNKCFEAIFFQMIKLTTTLTMSKFLFSREEMGNGKKFSTWKLSNDNRIYVKKREYNTTTTPQGPKKMNKKTSETCTHMNEWINGKKSEQQQNTTWTIYYVHNEQMKNNKQNERERERGFVGTRVCCCCCWNNPEWIKWKEIK